MKADKKDETEGAVESNFAEAERAIRETIKMLGDKNENLLWQYHEAVKTGNSAVEAKFEEAGAAGALPKLRDAEEIQRLAEQLSLKKAEAELSEAQPVYIDAPAPAEAGMVEVVGNEINEIGESSEDSVASAVQKLMSVPPPAAAEADEPAVPEEMRRLSEQLSLNMAVHSHSERLPLGLMYQLLFYNLKVEVKLPAAEQSAFEFDEGNRREILRNMLKTAQKEYDRAQMEEYIQGYLAKGREIRHNILRDRDRNV